MAYPVQRAGRCFELQRSFGFWCSSGTKTPRFVINTFWKDGKRMFWRQRVSASFEQNLWHWKGTVLIFATGFSAVTDLHCQLGWKFLMEFQLEEQLRLKFYGRSAQGKAWGLQIKIIPDCKLGLQYLKLYFPGEFVPLSRLTLNVTGLLAFCTVQRDQTLLVLEFTVFRFTLIWLLY